MRKYKTTGNTTLFDAEEKERKLTEMGDPLERLSRAVDFEMFRSELEDALLPKERKSNAGAKRYDVVMMFKLMVLQRYYNLSDEQAEFQIVDRTSFRRFLGLAEGDRIPDARTIWLFRERLVKSGKVGDLFQKFVDYLNGKGLIFNEGRVVDASFVSVPKQRNTPDENKRIKAGEGDCLWEPEEGDSEEDMRRKANKKHHKDTEARWTKKGGVNYFGYKNHIKGDTKSKLILAQEVTPASVHDSQPTDTLLEESDKGQPLYGDSAYVGQEETLEKYRMKDEICEKGYRGHPLTEEQKESNREKSRTRCRVEHIFGFMENTMNRLYIRTVGLARATAVIGLINLTYNMSRYEQIVRLNLLKK